MDRVVVFVDGSNLYFGCRNFGFKAPWNITGLAQDLAGPGRKLIRAYYYNARSREEDLEPEKYRAEDKFYDHLRRQDYCTVRLGRLQGKAPVVHQKGVDTLLVQDILTLTFSDAFDCAVLVSNDGDFARVIEEVKSRGKQVEVAFVGEPAFHLREVCDCFVDLKENFPRHFEKLP